MAFIPEIKYLLLLCPPTIKASLQPPAGSLNAKNYLRDKDFVLVEGENYLRLFVQPDDYKPERTYGGGNPSKYSRSFASPQLLVSSYVREMEVTIRDERAVLQSAVELISAASLSTDLQSHTPVKLIDFVLPETSDRIAAIAASTPTSIVQPSTIRYGSITNPVASAGAVGAKGLWTTGGFSFRFEEVLLRT